MIYSIKIHDIFHSELDLVNLSVPAYEFIKPELKTDTGETGKKQYSLQAFGVQYNLHLQRNEHLISPGK